MAASDGPQGVTIFCAKPVGLAALEALAEERTPITSIVAVSGEAETDLKELAEGLKAPFYSDLDLKNPDTRNEILSYNPFAAMSVSYPNRIPVALLDRLPGGAFNFHPARLPEYRGCFPTMWPILNGDSHADYTMHTMEESFDTGPVIDRETLAVESHETGWSLYLRLVESLPGLIRRNVDDILAGRCQGIPQDGGKAGYYSSDLPHGGVLDWNWDGRKIDRFVRALYHPVFPGAKALINKVEVEVLQIGDMEPGAPPQVPGTVISGPNGIAVCCGNGRIGLKTIRYQGETLSLGNGNAIPSIFQ